MDVVVNPTPGFSSVLVSDGDAVKEPGRYTEGNPRSRFLFPPSSCWGWRYGSYPE